MALDSVPTAPNRSELGTLLIPHPSACRTLCPDLPPTSSLEEVLAHPSTRAYFRDLLVRLARTATGSASRIKRALLIAEPLSLDLGEVTDKGSVVQSTVRSTRAALIDKLYSDDADVLHI